MAKAKETNTNGPRATQARMRFTCEMITPLMMDRMTEEVLEGLYDKAKRPQKGAGAVKPMADVAKSKIYRDDEDNIVMPVECFLAALNHGGRFVKIDAKRSFANKDESLVPAVLDIQALVFPLKKKDGSPVTEADMIVDKRRGRLKDMAKTACCVVRPKFMDWQFDVELTVDLTETNTDLVLKVLEQAGKKAGLGSFRPSCKGNFGKFKITNVEITELA